MVIKDLVRLGSGKYKMNVLYHFKFYSKWFNKAFIFIKLTKETWDLIKQSRQVVNDLISEHKCIYGINTGFGKFASTVIPDDQLEYLKFKTF